MFENNLIALSHNLSADDILLLGQKTEGYKYVLNIRYIYICIYHIFSFTGADLHVICRDAGMNPVRKYQKAKKFKQIDGFWEPTYYSDPYGIEMTLFQIVDPKLLRPPPVTYVHIYIYI